MLLRSVAETHVATFKKIFVGLHKDRAERKDILAAIGSFSQCLDTQSLEKMYLADCAAIIQKPEELQSVLLPGASVIDGRGRDLQGN